MTEFNVTIGELIQKANSLSELNGQFKTQVGTMVDLEGSLQSMWIGDAKESFHNAFSSDVKQMDTFYKTVNKYVEVLLNAAGKYQTTEAQNMEIANTRKYH